jgi:hypothetical protein
MYGTSEGVSESNGGVMQPGVHKVFIESVTLETINTSGYDGQAIDVVFENEAGVKSTRRVFPFKYQPSWTDRNNNPIDQATQLKQYLGKNLHMFKYALDGTDQTYFNTVATATDFPAYCACLQKMTKAQGGNQFQILIVAEKGKYPKYPWWQGGVAGSLTDTLVYNAEKHGYKQMEGAAMETAEGEDTNKLPF